MGIEARSLKWFSQRKGLKPIKTKMQIDSIDDDLKNRLWSALHQFYWSQKPFSTTDDHNFRTLFTRFWDRYFKLPLDTLPYHAEKIVDVIREFYFHRSEWYDAYDIIEFVGNNYPYLPTNESFMEYCNSILESEVSAYRFVGGRITSITSEEEISEIEEALVTPLKPVRTHLKKALDLLSDKKAPDYRNSIKESISAVESMCNKITGSRKATLGKCLDKIDSKMPLHGALKEAFDHLYGYASSEEGIRHGSIKESEVDFDIAKFMLVSCSAFINYLVSKASKAGIKL